MNADVTLNAEQAEWLHDRSLQRLMVLLEADRHEVRVNGGAVRNALLGQPVNDIDLSSTRTPNDTIKLLDGHDIRVVPTGVEHGTVTAVLDHKSYEITTLREDIETDGRHAVVRFGTDWTKDAERRDLTFNALYCDRNGKVFDPLGSGLCDLEGRVVRFIGDAATRITEDHLRILRFFRFFAWYGAGRPDADGLKACARLKTGIRELSAERVWAELKKLLSAPDPARGILWMRQVGVLTTALPETEKWGIDLVPAIIDTETVVNSNGGVSNNGPDPMLRLMAMIRPHEETVSALASRLKLSNSETRRLIAWATSSSVAPDAAEADIAVDLYCGDHQGILDASLIKLARLRQNGVTDDEALKQAAALETRIAFARDWVRPTMPVSGKDLLAAGYEPGEAMGDELKRLETEWITNGFVATPEMLSILDTTTEEG